MTEATQLQNIETAEKKRYCRCFKAKVIDSLQADKINKTIKESFKEKSIVFTDDSTSNVDISDYV